MANYDSIKMKLVQDIVYKKGMRNQAKVEALKNVVKNDKPLKLTDEHTKEMALIRRFENWIDSTEREMKYLKKSLSEIKGDLV